MRPAESRARGGDVDSSKDKQPLATLSGLAAHNAVGGLVQMYAGVVADYERQLEMTRTILEGKDRAAEAGANAGAEEIKKLREKLAQKEQEAGAKGCQIRELQRQLDLASGKDASRRELAAEESTGSSW